MIARPPLGVRLICGTAILCLLITHFFWVAISPGLLGGAVLALGAANIALNFSFGEIQSV